MRWAAAPSQCRGWHNRDGNVPRRTEYRLDRSDFRFQLPKTHNQALFTNPLFFSPPRLSFLSEAIFHPPPPKAYSLTLGERQYARVKPKQNYCGWIMNFVCARMPSFDLKIFRWMVIIKPLLYQSASVYCDVGTSSQTNTATGPILKVCRQLPLIREAGYGSRGVHKAQMPCVCIAIEGAVAAPN